MPKKIEIRKLVFRHIIIFAIIISYMIFLHYFKIGCPVKYILKIPCPTCGATRAAILLLKGSFKESIKMYPLLIPLVVSIFLGIHFDTKLIKRNKAALAFIILTSVVIFISYLTKFI